MVCKWKLSFFLLCLVMTSALFAQTRPDALKAYRLGRSYDAAGKREAAKNAYNEAVSICKQELQANARNMDSYTVYTWALFRLGDYAQTEELCKKALQISPDRRIIETLGEARFFLGKYQESLHDMERYIEAAPTGERLSVAYFYVGEIYRLAFKQFRKADIAYSVAVQLEPNNPLWWYRLGLARENAGEKQGAIQAYRRAVRLQPDYPAAKEGLRRLGQKVDA